jgi:hypothetical protein
MRKLIPSRLPGRTTSPVPAHVPPHQGSDWPQRGTAPHQWLVSSSPVIRQVINALKEHILVKELLGKVAHLMAAPKATRGRAGATDWLDMREVAEQALIRAHVKAVFADEGHRLMQGDGSHSTDEQLEWLKSLTNRTNVLHVLAGPYALFGFRNTSGQLARRGRDVHFPRYHVASPEERKEFAGAVQYLLERVPLTCDLEACSNAGGGLPKGVWGASGS